MGERTEFKPGDEAPNNGVYIEIGERDHTMGINDPAQIHMEKGQKFPETSNHNRKWTRMHKGIKRNG
ncbi:YjzC family protein [Gorillibacterium massiliense]|uniref:YjzC family protein n=1 Tax=Gorillibacterium massiliense TaxID=1280390 RepID=UPI0004B188B0|nr:YjzC family protein [Gorillibacterium massiliense]